MHFKLCLPGFRPSAFLLVVVAGFGVGAFGAAPSLAVRNTDAGSLDTRTADARVTPAGPSQRSAGLEGVPCPAWQPGLVFRFGLGAPASGLPLLRGEDLFVASVVGGVHRLSREGSYIWSHTLEGAPLGSPVADPGTERVFVALASGQVAALQVAGGLLWRYPVPARITSGVVLGPRGFLYFTDSDAGLYALARHGQAVWRLTLDAQPVGEPVAVADKIVVATRGPSLWFVDGAKRAERVELPESPAELSGLGFSVLVRGARQLLLVGPAGVSAAWPGVEALAGDGSQAVALLSGARLLWFSQGEARELELPQGTQAPSLLALAAPGEAALATEAGELLRARATGQVELVGKLCGARALQVGWVPARAGSGAASGLLLVLDRNHMLSAFEWPEPRSP